MKLVFWLLISVNAHAFDDLRSWVLHVKSVALKNDQDHLVTVNAYKAAQSANRQATYEFAPSVNYSASIDDEDKFAAHAVTASINLFNGMQDYHQKKEAVAALKEKYAEVKESELNIEVQAAKRSVRWLDLLMREETLKKELESRRISLEIMEKRFRRGIVAEDEVLKLKVDALGSEVELQGLQARLEKENNDFESEFDVELRGLQLKFLPEPNFEKIIWRSPVPKALIQDFPEVKAKFHVWQAAKANHRQAVGALYSPSIDGSYTYENSPNSSTPYEYEGTAAITVTLPIFSQLEDLDAEVQAKLAADSARLDYENELEDAETSYKNRIAELKKLKESFALQKRSVELADKFYSQSVKRFRLGVGDSNNMAFDLQRLTRAKLGLSRIKKEIFEAALDLNALLGQPAVDVL